MHASAFVYTADTLRQIARDVLQHARASGASACETEISESAGLSVCVRKGAVETIEHNRDKGLGVTVYYGQRRGHASSADFSPAALRTTVEAACAIARYTAEDACAGLADPQRLATPAQAEQDLDLFHPWALTPAQAITLAQRCEAAALAVSDAVTNSEGATVSAQQGHFVAANSLGFMGGYASSRHWLSCVPIAGQGENMQRDDWFSSQRDPQRLAAPEAIGDYAARRALARLSARRLPTCRVPVLLEAPLACGLLGSFVHALSGGALYRKASFLLDSLGQQVFPSWFSLRESPHLVGGNASAPFDDDGVATAARMVVAAGVVQGYFLSSYSGRKLGLASTGNAGGSHNLLVEAAGDAGGDDLTALLRRMGRGLFVTELLGHGINYVTGDYSRGAAGFWVEGGEIQYPVHEITIAGNLRDMLRNIAAVGNDIDRRGGKHCGSLLLAEMQVAGA